jgi:hypothetical protein
MEGVVIGKSTTFISPDRSSHNPFYKIKYSFSIKKNILQSISVHYEHKNLWYDVTNVSSQKNKSLKNNILQSVSMRSYILKE